MSMETDFRAILADSAGVANLVATRIYPATYAQGAASPCVRYAKITGSPGLHMQGSDGLAQELMQVDIRAATAASALAVRDAIFAALTTYHAVKGNTDFRLISLRDDRGVQFETTGAQSFYTASLDWDVWSRTT